MLTELKPFDVLLDVQSQPTVRILDVNSGMIIV